MIVQLFSDWLFGEGFKLKIQGFEVSGFRVSGCRVQDCGFFV